MGTIVKVSTADFSQNNVGKLDSFLGIVRPNIDGNVVTRGIINSSEADGYSEEPQSNFMIGADKVDIKLKCAFKFENTGAFGSSGQTLLVLSDFNTNYGYKGVLYISRDEGKFCYREFQNNEQGKLYIITNLVWTDSTYSADLSTKVFSGTEHTILLHFDKSDNNSLHITGAEIDGVEYSFELTSVRYDAQTINEKIILFNNIDKTRFIGWAARSINTGFEILKDGVVSSLIDLNGESNNAIITDKISHEILTTPLAGISIFTKE